MWKFDVRLEQVKKFENLLEDEGYKKIHAEYVAAVNEASPGMITKTSDIANKDTVEEREQALKESEEKAQA